MKRYVYICCLCLSFLSARGQISQGGKPYSFSSTLRDYNSDTIRLKENLISFEMPKIRESVFDSILQNNMLNNEYQFAYDFHTSINVKEQSTIDSIDVGIIYRLVVKSEGAKSLNLIFDEFSIPRGAKLFIYSKDKKNIIGAFTSNNNNGSRKLPTVPVYGDEIVVEYFEPYFSEFAGSLKIIRVNHDFMGICFDQVEEMDKDEFEDCYVDINCSPEGDSWQEEKRAICRVIRKGTATFSGSLVNNTNMDGIPYFLTANHCISTQQMADVSVFIFNYERPGCKTGQASSGQSISSGTLRATNSQSDFSLIELSHRPLSSWNPYYAGWDRREEQSAGGVCIHHPSGKPKKISTYNIALVNTTCTNLPQDNYYRVTNWIPTTNGYSIAEEGSSGAPLFNNSHKIIGQLYGMCSWFASFCDNPSQNKIDFGKFLVSWNNGETAETRLKDWLDPIESNVFQLEGSEVCPQELANNLTLTHTVNSGVVEIKQATQNISSSCFISEGANVSYKAGQNINLVSGFHAEQGSRFYATTGNEPICVPGCYPMTLSLDSQVFSNGGNICFTQTNATSYHLRLVNYLGQEVYQYSGATSSFQCCIPILTVNLAVGRYIATITLINECGEMSESYLMLCIGGKEEDSYGNDSLNLRGLSSIHTDSASFDFDVYPNPSNGVFQINVQVGTVYPYSIEIITSMGQTLYHIDNIKEKTIEIAKACLPVGLYLVTIRMNDISKTKKLIIE